MKLPSQTDIHFVTSAYRFDQCPPPLSWEVAFIGPSNVGKSSLLNGLFGKPVAKVSATPGKTQLLNFFASGNAGYFVDLPGYGYACVPTKLRHHWGHLIEYYLKNRASLRLLVCLVDARRGVQEEERELFAWADHAHRPYLLLLNKMDKLNQSERALVIKRASQLEIKLPPIFCSTKSGEGQQELWNIIRTFCG